MRNKHCFSCKYAHVPVWEHMQCRRLSLCSCHEDRFPPTSPKWWCAQYEKVTDPDVINEIILLIECMDFFENITELYVEELLCVTQG